MSEAVVKYDSLAFLYVVLSKGWTVSFSQKRCCPRVGQFRFLKRDVVQGLDSSIFTKEVLSKGWTVPFSRKECCPRVGQSHFPERSVVQGLDSPTFPKEVLSNHQAAGILETVRDPDSGHERVSLVMAAECPGLILIRHIRDGLHQHILIRVRAVSAESGDVRE